MVADLREMQENQWVSEIQIDKSGFVEFVFRSYGSFEGRPKVPQAI